MAESIRSFRQELPETYTSFAKKCHEAALYDTSDHLFLSFCGLEVLCSSLLQNDWQALQTIVPQLILDWHGMAEQSRNAAHLLLYKTPNQTHRLVALSKKIGEYSDWREQNLTEEQRYLQDLDNGQMWVRFSKSSQWNLRTSRREEKGLKMIKLASRIGAQTRQNSAEVDQNFLENMRKLLAFVFETHSHTIKDMFKHRIPEQIGDKFRIPLNDIMKRLKEELLRITQACEKRPIQSLRFEENSKLKHFKNFLNSKLKVLKDTKQKLEGVDISKGAHVPPKVLASDAEWQFKQLLGSVTLYDRLSPHLDAWFLRGPLEVQWGFEQIYRLDLESKGISNIRSHRFETFQNLLKSAKDKSDNVNAFDFGSRLYYPQISRVFNDPEEKPLISLFIERTAANQEFAEEKLEGEVQRARFVKNRIFQTLRKAVDEISVYLKNPGMKQKKDPAKKRN